MHLDRTTFLTLVMTASFSALGCGGSEPAPAAEASPQTTSGAEETAPPPAEPAPAATEPAAPVDPVVEQPGPAFE